MTYNWGFERSIHSVRLMAEFAVDAGSDYKTILKKTGLDELQLLDSNIIISSQQELQVIHNLIERFTDQHALGLQVGSKYHFTTFGALGMALMSSAHVREALDLALNYFPLTFALTNFIVSDTPNSVRIDIVDNGISDPVRQFIIERDVAALITVQRDLIAGNFCEAIEFSFELKGDIQPYLNLFGTKPKFGAAKSFLLFDAEKLKQKLKMANALFLHTAEQQCREILEQRQSKKKFTQQVQQHLMNLRGEMPSMEIVANRLHLNVRTLRRHLAQENMTFIQIREEVRQVLAEQYLSLPYVSIEKIAEWLGYAESTSFIHAYKRWHGTTPYSARLQGRS